MIICAAIIIFLGLVVHGFMNRQALIDHEVLHASNQREIQRRQQSHETEFARKQAEMFRANQAKSKTKSAPLTEAPYKVEPDSTR